MICPSEVMECWESCNEVQLADAKNYYTKAQVDEKIDDIEVSGVTEEKAQEMIDESLQGYATEEWVNDQGFLKEHQSLDNYYTKSETDGFLSDLEASDGIISGMVNNLSTMLEREAQRAISAETQIDENISNLSGNVADLGEAIETIEGELAVDIASKEWVSGFTYDKATIEDMIEEGGGFLPENYYDKAATDALLAKKANTATTYTKANVNSLLAKKADTATTYTKDEINAFIDSLETTDSVLDGRVDTLTTDLETEVQRAQNAEAAISGTIPSVEGYFDGADYNSNTKRINFKHGNTVKTYIDATDFIKDGMVSNVEIVGNNLVITFNSDSGHETITIPLTDIFNPNNYYTKTEVDAKDAAVEAKIPSLVGYATQEWVSGYTYDKQTIEDMIEEGGGFVPEDYYDKDTTDALLAAKADTASTYTKSEVDDLIPDISGKQDISGMTAYTTTSTTNVLRNTVTAHTANTSVHVTAAEKETWNNKSDFSGSYNDLTNKPTIPVVPTNVSDFTNDAGYITIDAISGKADTSAVTEAISAATSGKADSNAVYTKTEVDTALNQKQNTLTAGSGITISNNTISTKIWSGTKAAFEALTTKDSDTIYLIYNE